MQKKILRIFALSVVFIGVLGPIGTQNSYGMYTEALEDEVIKNQCRRFACRPNKKGKVIAAGNDWVDMECNCLKCGVVTK